MKKQALIVELTFTESELPNTPPVARLDNGKMCLLHHEFSPHNIKAGETWKCQITFEEKFKAIVIPLELLRSSQENEKVFKDKLELLKLKFA